MKRHTSLRTDDMELYMYFFYSVFNVLDAILMYSSEIYCTCNELCNRLIRTFLELVNLFGFSRKHRRTNSGKLC